MHHGTSLAFEMFGSVYTLQVDKNPIRPGFEPGTSKLRAYAESKEAQTESVR